MKNAFPQLSLPFVGRWAGDARVNLKSAPLLGLLVCVAYYLGARLGFALTLAPQPVSVLWPPNSILLAALLLTPPRWWWFIVLAVAPAHWAAQLQSDVPQAMIVCWFISNCFEAVIGAACVRYFSGGEVRFDSFSKLGIFLGCAVFFAPFVSSFVDAGFVALNGWGQSSYWEVWGIRFFSNVLATLTLVPPIVLWSRTVNGSLRKIPPRRVGEAALLITGVMLVAYFFLRQQGALQRQPVLLLPFLLWVAVRFGVKGTSTAIFAVTLMAIWSAAHGHGPFSTGAPMANALSLQVFLIVISIPLLCLATLIEERSRAEQRYREVVETQSDLVCRFLPDTTLTFVNQAYCRFFNRRPEELIGTKFIELIPEAGHEKVLKQIASLVRDPGVQTIESEAIGSNGSIAWYHWVNHAVCGPDGQVVEFQGIGRDISDRKRAEEANLRLTHVSRLATVGELTASIAHEINQPLGAILSNADAAGMLLEAFPEKVDDLKEILADIRKADMRASELIRHLRVLLRKRELDMQPLDINEVALDAVRLIRGDAQRRGVKWTTEFASGLSTVEGDRVHLQQVFLNLIVNAMDAMADMPHERRQLIIRTAPSESGSVEVRVQDSGCGIPSDRLPRLFESFFSTKVEGMGLGLSISRTIIEAHRGLIWAENQASGGATFGFKLPGKRD